MKDIKTLPQDIYDVLTNDVDLRHDDPEVAAEFMVRIMEHYHRAVGNETRERKENVLYASEIGKPCNRQVWYQHYMKEVAEPISGAARYKFLYGDVIEELTLELCEAAGHTVEGRQQSFELEINGWRVRGRADAIIDGITVDVKSASKFAFNNYQKLGLCDETDKFGYRDQLMFYTTQGLVDGVVNTNEAYFLFVSKELGNISLIPQQASYEPVDMVDKIEEKIEVLENTDTPPSRGFDPVPDGASGNEKLAMQCSYCAFKKECWPGLRGFSYSGYPRFLTTVVREPKVPELDLTTE